MHIIYIYIDIGSGVTNAPATLLCRGGTLGGGILLNSEFTVFKRKIVRLGSKMDHISTNLAFGRREKNIWGYEKLQGGKKPIRKTEKKKVATFFLDSKIFVGAAKNQQGAPNGNVTPLDTGTNRINSQSD